MGVSTPPAHATDAAQPPGDVDLGLLAEVLTTTGEGVVICDEDMRYVWANPAACRLMGYRLEELRGRNFLMNFPERMHSAMVQTYRAQLAGQTGTFAGTLRRPDHQEVDMTWSNMSFGYGGRRYGAAIFRDVTDLTATTREVAGLAQAAELTAQGGELIDVLTQLADSGREHTRALAIALDLVDPDLVIRRGGRSGTPAGFAEAQTAVSAAGGRIPFIDVWYAGRAVVLGDARTRLRQDPAFTPLCDALDAGLDWQSAVYAAIGYRGRVLGGMCAYFPARVASPSDQELTYLTALADYAALAIELARLRTAGERAAALEERARLARDLHDSVSQALFSMTLHARAADKNLQRLAAGADPATVLPKTTADVTAMRELTASALAEMRALIFELRPESLAEHGLLQALSRQAAALIARTSVPVRVSGPPGRLPLAPQAEEHAYRITLEAVHNALKHAAPSEVSVAITDLGDEVTVVIADDGTGFDHTQPRLGHLGLRTMRERARLLRGTLDLRTAPGRGTTLTLAVPATPAEIPT